MFTKPISLIVVLYMVSSAFSTKIEYHGYKMYNLVPHTKTDIAFLKEMYKQRVMFLREPLELVGSSNLVALAPHQYKGDILEAVFETGITVEETVSDVQKLIDEELIINNEPLKDGRLPSDRYHRLNDIYEFLDTQARIHSSFVSTVNIGVSYEGRNLTAIKISKSNETKPAIWIDANIHAREWITGAVGTHIIDELLNNGEYNALIDNYDWYILPIANPDGYEYTFTHDRFWRKTRSNSTSPLGCKGADPNRNFDFKFWEDGGASDDPCSMTYRGSGAFSEPETKAMGDFIRTISTRLVFYLSLHSAGQYILIPTGFSSEPIPDFDTYLEIGNLAAAAHLVKYNTSFTPGNIVDLMYKTTGISMDYVWTEYNLKLAFTYELRDKGRYGHLLPSNLILPSQEEFMDGFKVIMDKLGELVSKST